MTQTLGKITADFQTQLATALAVGGTSCTIQSVTDDDGNTLPNGTYFFTIDGDNSQKEHIKCTLSSTSLSSIQSVARNGTLSSGVVRKHRVGATVTITNFLHIKAINNLLDGTTDFDSGTPLGYDGDPGLSSGTNKFATVNYVDGVAIAGGADASTSVKGISKLSTAPASATNPIAVGDNDPRVPTADENDALAGTSGAPSSSNKYVTNDDTDNAATANKVARYDSNGDLIVPTTPTDADAAASKTYVDGLTGVQPFYQKLLLAITDTAQFTAITSKTDGTVVYTATNTTVAQNIIVTRWALDTVSGTYYQTHQVTKTIFSVGDDVVDDTKGGIVVIGSYVYLTVSNTSQQVTVRFDEADLTNAADCSYSGGSPTLSDTKGSYTDGTDIYVNDTGTTWKKYTISGTTLTFDSNVTSINISTAHQGTWDGTHVLFSAGDTIHRYTAAGSSVSSITRDVGGNDDGVIVSPESSIIYQPATTTTEVSLIPLSAPSTS